MTDKTATQESALARVNLSLTVDSPAIHSRQLFIVLAESIVPLATVPIALAIHLWVVPVQLTDLALFGAFYVLTLIGIEVGYHRMLTHRAFATHAAIRNILVIAGSMAGQGPPLFWVATHRRHHENADAPDDPHSPYFCDREPVGLFRGLWHAHFTWMLDTSMANPIRYSPEILRDRSIMAIERTHMLWFALGQLLPAIAGWLLSGTVLGAFTGFFWGGQLRVLAVSNMTWLINSVGHTFGRQSFETREESRNIPLLAIPSLGLAWHNNHHAFPSAAILSFRWWQIDPSGLLVVLLERLGLAWNVKRPDVHASSAPPKNQLAAINPERTGRASEPAPRSSR